MRITTKGRYALRAMLNLALACQARPVPIKQIAADEEISAEFLEQIFFKLKKADIILSVRGPGGGFKLNRDPENINVRSIFEAVGEGIGITPCTSCDTKEPEIEAISCKRINTCSTADFWAHLSNHLITYFETVTLKSLMEKSGDRMLSTMMQGQDFSI